MIRNVLSVTMLACLVHIGSAYDWSARFAGVSGGEPDQGPCPYSKGKKPCEKKADANGDCKAKYETTYKTPVGFLAEYTVNKSDDFCKDENCEPKRDYVPDPDCIDTVIKKEEATVPASK